MLFAVLGGRRQSIDEADQILERVRESAELRREVSDLLEILADRIRTVSRPLDPTGEVPLASHATYTLGEIVAAHRHIDKHGALDLSAGRSTVERGDADGSPVRHAGEVGQGLLALDTLRRLPGLADTVSLGVAEHRLTRYPYRAPVRRTTDPGHKCHPVRA